MTPLTGAPTTLIQWAVLILNTPNPILKVSGLPRYYKLLMDNESQVERTRHAAQLLFTGKLVSVGNKSANAPQPPAIPPREASFSRNTVDVSRIKSRKNRAVMLHALANIEQWA